MLEEDKFDNVLKSFRVRKGKAWTQKKTANLLNVSHRTYSGWENGESVPIHHDLEMIVATFELSEHDTNTLYRAAAQVPPLVHNLPFPKNPFFTGRQKHLERLECLLKENSNVGGTQPVSINGLGGIGKTQLALEYAHRYYPMVYRTVFWVSAADKTTLEEDYTRIAHLLNLPEKHVREADLIAEAVKKWLEAHTKWLLILDNADDLQLVSAFLPIKHQGHILLTTRSQIVGAIAKPIELEGMEPEEGLIFLMRRSGLLKDTNKLAQVASEVRDTATELVNLLRGLPLALDQAGAYIEETSVSLADYTHMYHEECSFLLNRRGSTGSEHPEAVATTVKLSFRKACQLQPLTADILYFCLFLHPDAIPEELLRRSDDLRFDKTLFNEAIAALRRYSLIKRNTQEKLLSIHRLVQEVLINTMSLDLRKQWFLCVQRTLSKAEEEDLWGERAYASFSGTYSENKVKPKRSEKPGQSLFRHAETALGRADAIDKRFPDIFISLFLDGEPVFSLEERTHSELKYREARYQKRLSWAEKEYGTDHFEIIVILCGFTDMYVEWERYDLAEALYERAVSTYDHNLGKKDMSADTDLIVSHILMGHLYYKWAKLLQAQEKYEQAAILYIQALNALDRFWDQPNLYAALIKRDYAALLQSLGRDIEAVAVAPSLEPHVENFLPTCDAEDLLGLFALLEDEALQQELEDLD